MSSKAFDDEFERQYEEDGKRRDRFRAKAKAVGVGIGAGLAVVALPFATPLVATAAALGGATATYAFGRKSSSRPSSACCPDNQSAWSKLCGGNARAEPSRPEENPSSTVPSIRRLKFVVKWSKLQLAELSESIPAAVRVEAVEWLHSQRVVSKQRTVKAAYQKVGLLCATDGNAVDTSAESPPPLPTLRKMDRILAETVACFSLIVTRFNEIRKNSRFSQPSKEITREIAACRESLEILNKFLASDLISEVVGVTWREDSFPHSEHWPTETVAAVAQIFYPDPLSAAPSAALVLWLAEKLRALASLPGLKSQGTSPILASAVSINSSAFVTPIALHAEKITASFLPQSEEEIEFPPLGQEELDRGFYSASEGSEEEGSVNRKTHLVKGSGRHGDSLPLARSTDDLHCFAPMDASSLRIRGPMYLSDRIKFPSSSSMMETLAVDLFLAESPVSCVTRNPKCAAYRLLAERPDWFFFTVNWKCGDFQVACTLGCDKRQTLWINGTAPPERIALERFLEGSDSERKSKLKIIPSVIEGPWLAKKAVGQTPAIIGNKLATFFHSEHGAFCEVEVDVTSSSAARAMLGVLISAAKRLAIDVGVLIEGQKQDELPERVLGGFRVQFVDLRQCRRV